MRRLFGSVLVAALVVALSAQAALAAKPIHDRFVIQESIQEEVCGVAVTTDIHVKVNALIFPNRVIDVSLVRITFTNAEGDWLQDFVAGPVFITEELEGDILTVTVRHAGIHQRLRSSEGLTPAFDRGQIVFRDVIDLNDLEDPEDDVFLSSEVLSQAGPHPVADSDFALFCEVFIDVLG